MEWTPSGLPGLLSDSGVGGVLDMCRKGGSENCALAGEPCAYMAARGWGGIGEFISVYRREPSSAEGAAGAAVGGRDIGT